MKLRLISCEVFFREMCACIARSPNQVDLGFLPKGLHDLGAPEMQARLQAAIDDIETDPYDAILLGYGLCNHGLHNIVAPDIPLVLPRAHDCITLFLGNRKRYLDYFHANPGTYFKTSGWIERSEIGEELKQLSIGHVNGMDKTYEELVEEYGEDNADYLYETLVQNKKHYGQFTFIEMGVEPDSRFEDMTRRDAADRGWAFKKEQGDLRLIQNLIDGNWDEKDYLVVKPGECIAASFDEDIVKAKPGPD